MRRVLDRIDAPAIVMTPTHDILAWSPLAAALMVDFSEIPDRERNFMRLLFTDPRLRSLYPDWEGRRESSPTAGGLSGDGRPQRRGHRLRPDRVRYRGFYGAANDGWGDLVRQGECPRSDSRDAPCRRPCGAEVSTG
jgi:hypothetical protein